MDESSKISAKKKPTNFQQKLLPFQHPPKMKNLGGFLQGFWINTSCKMDYSSCPPSTLLRHRSIPHSIQHLKVASVGFADLQGVPLPLRKPSNFRGQRLMLLGLFGWFAWFLLVGWCVWFGLFGW